MFSLFARKNKEETSLEVLEARYKELVLKADALEKNAESLLKSKQLDQYDDTYDLYKKCSEEAFSLYDKIKEIKHSKFESSGKMYPLMTTEQKEKLQQEIDAALVVVNEKSAKLKNTRADDPNVEMMKLELKMYEMALEGLIAERNKNALLSQMRTINNSFRKITDKNACLRVRILDSIANYIELRSTKVVKYIRDTSNNIENPCVIKIPSKT